MPKHRKRTPEESARADDLVFEGEHFLDRLSAGTWAPNVDLCETKDDAIVRIELPGVDPADVSLTFENGLLRVHGLKREPPRVSEKLICYFCVERRYGKFDRELRINWVVDGHRSQATLENGILTVTIPKIAERRGRLIKIPIR